MFFTDECMVHWAAILGRGWTTCWRKRDRVSILSKIRSFCTCLERSDQLWRKTGLLFKVYLIFFTVLKGRRVKHMSEVVTDVKTLNTKEEIDLTRRIIFFWALMLRHIQRDLNPLLYRCTNLGSSCSYTFFVWYCLVQCGRDRIAQGWRTNGRRHLLLSHIFSFLLPERHIYIKEYAYVEYTHIWLCGDCMWITVATK